MKVRLNHIASFYLLIGTILLAIGLSSAFTCPEQCSCSNVQRKQYNHAKCTSLDGLRQLGKTSELHSLDLSSMNLTKITNQLDKLTNLSKLDLADNRLSEINSLAAKRIRILNLSQNRITSGKLAKIPSTVKHLNLSHNEITVLPESFKHFIHLKSLELADNPLNCTCETLDVRNWLQEHKVWTEKPIRCAAPLKHKGRSWLSVAMSEVCDPHGLETPRMLPFSDPADDENLLFGDDPNAGQFADESEGFFPVSSTRSKRTGSDSWFGFGSDDDDNNNDEGSGDDAADQSLPLQNQSNDEATEDEGSGDMEEASSPSSRFAIDDDNQESNQTDSLENDDNLNASNETVALINAPVSLNSTGVLNSNENASIEEDGTTEEASIPVNEEIIVPIVHKNDVEEVPTPDGNPNVTAQSEQTRTDPVERADSKSTYILLAVLGVLLIVLILYVATKRSRTNTKNRRNNNDIESNGQELANMDKHNLGKPIPKPVEFIPLIPDDVEKKANLCNGDEPLLQKLTEVDHEHDANNDATQTPDDNKQTPAKQQLNGNAKPIQNGVHPDNKVNDNAVNDQRPPQPISPKPSRYSPVYSHDTGRVKIKLSETSRPKTPILVTRTRSNAADNKDNTNSQ